MKDAAGLSEEERPVGSHNPVRGDYRLRHLAQTLRPVLEG